MSTNVLGTNTLWTLTVWRNGSKGCLKVRIVVFNREDVEDCQISTLRLKWRNTTWGSDLVEANISYFKCHRYSLVNPHIFKEKLVWATTTFLSERTDPHREKFVIVRRWASPLRILSAVVSIERLVADTDRNLSTNIDVLVFLTIDTVDVVILDTAIAR